MSDAKAQLLLDRGVLLISLDFELHWGVHDLLSLDDYRDHLLGVRRVVPALLELFDEFSIHATWATVGLLFFQTREELMSSLPAERPQYTNARLSPYPLLHTLGNDETEDPFHYASSLIEMIRSHPHQEIGSHTFSHYYCLEKGQTAASFRADLAAAIAAARQRGVVLESFVFPRNYFNPEYMGICREMGIRAYRGNPPSWMYRPDESLAGKAARFLDTYVNLSGHSTYAPGADTSLPINLPASRFLRPCSRRLAMLEGLRLRRIENSLEHAARERRTYHLWWHPHNFGANTDQNLAFLRRVLACYARLRDRFGMESLNMGEMAHTLAEGGR